MRAELRHHWLQLRETITSKRSLSDWRVHISTQKNKLEASIYFRNNKEEFHRLEEYKDQIDEIMGEPVEFREANIDSKIIVSKDAPLNDRKRWDEYYDWFAETAVKLKEVADKWIIKARK